MPKLQKIAVRLILDCDYSVPSIELFKTLYWQPFEDIVKYNRVLLAYKSLNNLAPNYMSDFLYIPKTLRLIDIEAIIIYIYIIHTDIASKDKRPKI